VSAKIDRAPSSPSCCRRGRHRLRALVDVALVQHPHRVVMRRELTVSRRKRQHKHPPRRVCWVRMPQISIRAGDSDLGVSSGRTESYESWALGARWAARHRSHYQRRTCMLCMCIYSVCRALRTVRLGGVRSWSIESMHDGKMVLGWLVALGQVCGSSRASYSQSCVSETEKEEFKDPAATTSRTPAPAAVSTIVGVSSFCWCSFL
jgi:hypothetical protein